MKMNIYFIVPFNQQWKITALRCVMYGCARKMNFPKVFFPKIRNAKITLH
jgi:hypothetical protein